MAFTLVPLCPELKSQPVAAPDWLYLHAVVYDHYREMWGEVMDLGFPREKRQLQRAWLRPEGGGMEWNPPFSDLGPDPESRFTKEYES